MRISVRKHIFPHISRLMMLSLIFTAGSFSLFASAQQEEPAVQTQSILTDMRGREIEVPENIDGIIALDAGSLRLLCYMGEADRIIAVEDAGHGREKSPYGFFSLATYRIAFPELKNLPSIGNKDNHEGIIAAAPDIIISSTVDAAQLDQLQLILGIPVFGVDVDVELYDTELFYRQLNTLGSLLGKEARAKELITGIEESLTDLKSRKSEVTNPIKAYSGGMMYYGPADLLRTTGDYLPFFLSGAENVMPTNPAGNLQPYMTSLEDLISAAPDYVFIDAANINLSKQGFETNRGVLEEQVPAFTNRQVYSTFVYKYYGTNWENQLINVYYAGKILYPEIFGDFTIEDKAEEIWDLFFNVPLDFKTVTEQQKGGPAQVDWFN